MGFQLGLTESSAGVFMEALIHFEAHFSGCIDRWLTFCNLAECGVIVSLCFLIKCEHSLGLKGVFKANSSGSSCLTWQPYSSNDLPFMRNNHYMTENKSGGESRRTGLIIPINGSSYCISKTHLRMEVNTLVMFVIMACNALQQCALWEPDIEGRERRHICNQK